jgi:hypothetical protein
MLISFCASPDEIVAGSVWPAPPQRFRARLLDACSNEVRRRRVFRWLHRPAGAMGLLTGCFWPLADIPIRRRIASGGRADIVRHRTRFEPTDFAKWDLS